MIATSVIRSSHQGQSHGGVYLIDLATDEYVQVVDWNDGSISWAGRGGERGLRGVAFHGDRVFLAASDEIFVFDSRLRPLTSITSRYLKHCHEIFIHRDRLYATSTGYDSVLVFDLSLWRFTVGLCFRPPTSRAGSLAAARLIKATAKRLRPVHPGFYRLVTSSLRSRRFDPAAEAGPQLFDLYHINSVYADDAGIYVSGAGLDRLFRVFDGGVEPVAEVPLGTHSTRIVEGRLIYHDTPHARLSVVAAAGGPPQHFTLPHYTENRLLNAHLRRDHARQGFGRGLCLAGDLIIAGSSPATVCIFAPKEGRALKSINLTLDLRNAIHGLEIWPFDRRLADWRTRCAAAPDGTQAAARPAAAGDPAPASIA